MNSEAGDRPAAEIDFFPQRGEVAAQVRTKDWERTPLGSPATWPLSLRTALRIMLTSRYAMWMGWGPDLLMFYNDAYVRQTLGAKHPASLGRPFREVWSEIWDTLETRITHVLTTGEATWDEGLLLFLERSGYPEETYHTFSYSPAPGDSPGDIGGLFCVVVEETQRVIGERQIALLRDLGSLLNQKTQSAEDVFAAVDRCLTRNARDIPFALTYLFEQDGKVARRASCTNIARAHPAARERIAVDDSAPWPFHSVLSSKTPVLVDLAAEQAWPTGAWTAPPSLALVVPIDQGLARPAGVFIAGLNPHRPFGKSTQSFVELFVGQVASGLSNARAYEEERRRADALAEIDRAKTTFFTNVSHEFRTPLTLMLAPIEDMRAELRRDDVERGRIDLLHRNALRLLKLVNTLLDFSRIEAGRVEAAYEPTDLAALTADLASSFRSAVERAGLKLVVDCARLPAPIYVDHDMWEKIVLNLLSNAFKFTFEGSITVRLQGVDDGAELEITDTGTGIAERDLPRLFERFRRIEGARSRSYEGSGIGLALVHELVRMHGGEIQVKSRVDEGTTIRVRIPAGTSHLPPGRLRAARAQSSTAAGSRAFVEEALRWVGPERSDCEATPIATTARADDDARPRERILVADDNADMRDYVARLLRERWDVDVVGNGRDALAAIRRNPPDLVLSDVMMPGLDGFALVRAVRSDAALKATPVVLLSARAGEEATAEGLQAGADDYLIKPFGSRELLVRVAARLATAKAVRDFDAQRTNLYRAFLQAPFTFCIMRGSDLVVEFANDAMLRAWGKGRDVVGLPFARALPEIEGQPFIDLLHGVLRTGIHYEGRGERASLPTGPGGTMEDVFYNYVYFPLFGARGVVEGVFVAGFDVTEQFRSRERIEGLASQLGVASERLRAAQGVAGIGIFDWDVSSERVYWSPELYALMGLAPDAIDATPEAWTEKLFVQDRELGWGAFRDAVAHREGRMEVELRLQQPDGSTKWVRLAALILYDELGAPRRLIGAVIDVQALKETAEAERSARDRVEEAARLKDEFLATLSHELRTPLNSILGWAGMLKRDRHDEAKLKRGLDVIERNAQAQTRLVSDLLDVSRVISGKLRLTLKKTEVAAAIYAAADVVRQAADAKGVRLILNLDPDVGVTVGDPDRLQQIVWNLLTNAVRFTPARGTVTVTAERSQSAIRIRVQDTGAGIPHEHLPHIFERFRQVDSSTTRAHGGLGLGLAIVRYLVEAHGGTVAATSDGDAQGSTFTVSLPIHAVETCVQPEMSGDAEAELRATGTAAGTLAGFPLRGLRILVVEDDSDSLELLRLVLEGAGASVIAARSGRQALDVRGGFDVLISDIGMPEMDGYELIRRIRARPSGGSVPAIALTAYARGEDAERARRAGYQEHIAKPVNDGDLIATVARLAREPE